MNVEPMLDDSIRNKLHKILDEELADVREVVFMTSYGPVVSYEAKKRVVNRIIKELHRTLECNGSK